MSKRVLIVDDIQFVREALADYLKSYHFEVCGFAKDGNDALAKYRLLKPDWVCLDLILPFKNGVEVTQEIIKINPQAQIVWITSEGDSATHQLEAQKWGVKGILNKPFSPSEFEDAFASGIEISERKRA